MTEPVKERPYTVVGKWRQTGERWLGHYSAASPDMAEDLVASEALEQTGGAADIEVCAVFEGHIDNVDRHKWVDPSATTQEEMDQILREWWG
jgi:hypothetical protein